MTAILEGVGIGHRYGAAPQAALHGVDLRVAAGESIGIVGESGSGKSTLAKVLSGTLKPTEGRLLLRGRPWAAAAHRDPQRQLVQMVFQDPHGALTPWLTALETVSEAVTRWQRLARSEARERAADLLSDMGLSRDAMTRRPRELSGGQCQRVGIARALACRPEVLVADEPTSALDVSVQAQILNLLIGLRETTQLALVLISHDLAVIRHVTDSALVMYRGEVVETGKTHELLTNPTHSYTRTLMESARPRADDQPHSRTRAPSPDALST